MGEPGCWLIIVQPEQLDLYRHLEERFGELPFLEIVLDRRKGERRQSRVPVESDARRQERRQVVTPREREQWTLFGYRLVRGGEAPQG